MEYASQAPQCRRNGPTHRRRTPISRWRKSLNRQVEEEVASALDAATEQVETVADGHTLFDRMKVRQPEGIDFEVWYHHVYLRSLAKHYCSGRPHCYVSGISSTWMLVEGVEGSPTADEVAPALKRAPLALAEAGCFIGEPITSARRRFLAEDPLETPILYVVAFDVPVAREAEFDRWYSEEHTALLLGCPQWLMCRRFKVANARETLGWTHLALHYLTDLRALESPHRALARRTPWRNRLLEEPWFRPQHSLHFRILVEA